MFLECLSVCLFQHHVKSIKWIQMGFPQLESILLNLTEEVFYYDRLNRVVDGRPRGRFITIYFKEELRHVQTNTLPFYYI